MMRSSIFAALFFFLLTADSFGQDKRPNLLLVTIDTLRADYLGANGATEVRTPNLDRLAVAGVNFTRARSPVPLTLPAHASILTGKYPPAHGVRDNGVYHLGEEQLTLAEVLHEEGYRTAAFVASFVLDHRFGLAQGFDLYDDRTGPEVAELERFDAERNAEAVYESFSKWLNEYQDQRPFFVWVHLYDPHAPYAPPEPYRSQYPRNAYAGEVAYADTVAGQIISALESRQLLSRTVVAVVGDHGEGLGEHDEAAHSLLIYNSTLHVPMLIYAPGLVPAGRRVSELTRTIDLASTLLDLLGQPPELGQGMSLRPQIEESATGTETSAYSESFYPRFNLGWSELRGLEEGKYRFILAPQPELYDLDEDPGETDNRVARLPQVAREMRRKLEALSNDTLDAGRSAPTTMDSETQARLRSLGYLASARAPTASVPDGSLADPKSKMATWHLIQKGLSEFAYAQYKNAADTLGIVLKSEKTTPIVYEYLGASHLRLGNDAQAAEIYRQAFAAGIDSPDIHLSLGLIHFHRRELPEAREELDKALALDPLSAVAYYRLGDVFRAAGVMDQAIEAYRQALDINPAYVYALNGLGVTYASLDRNEEALDAFQRSVRTAPNEPRGYFNFAIQLERMAKNQEAIDAYQRFLDLATVGEFPAERQRAEDALRRLQ